VRFAVGFASIKVTAVFLGPSGIALVGQAANFLTLVQGTLGNAIQTAVTKLTAEQENTDHGARFALWGTALRLAVGLALVAGLALILLQRPLSVWLFGRADLAPVLVVVGLVLPLTLTYLVLTGVLTGLRQFRLISLTNIGATVLGAAIFIGLSFAYGLVGGLFGTILAVASGLLVVLVVVRLAMAFELRPCVAQWRPELLRPILAFYPMLLVHSAAEPLLLLLVRDALIDAAGAHQAGLWQATLRLSNMYTLVLVTTLSMYSLPTLSAISEPAKFRQTMMGMVTKMGGAAVIVAMAVYLLRDLIVRVVFTAEFLPVRDLMGWQLAGDVLMLAAWPLQSALMAQDRSKTYMAVEVGVTMLQFALTRGLLPEMGIAAAPAAYAATWAVGLVALLFLHRQTRAVTQAGPQISG
jgi:PST family polysaccharide transporter